jgi:hypothetical protein
MNKPVPCTSKLFRLLICNCNFSSTLDFLFSTIIFISVFESKLPSMLSDEFLYDYILQINLKFPRIVAEIYKVSLPMIYTGN